jgi:hypothetical protein
VFWFVLWNQKLKISVCYGVSNLYQNNWNKQNCFETNQNNHKFSEKYPNMLSFKLFWLVFYLFWFNRNIETLSFGIEAKQPKQTISKPTKATKNTKLSEKLPKYALHQTVSVALLFVLIQLKHRFAGVLLSWTLSSGWLLLAPRPSWMETGVRREHKNSREQQELGRASSSWCIFHSQQRSTDPQ